MGAGVGVGFEALVGVGTIVAVGIGVGVEVGLTNPLVVGTSSEDESRLADMVGAGIDVGAAPIVAIEMRVGIFVGTTEGGRFSESRCSATASTVASMFGVGAVAVPHATATNIKMAAIISLGSIRY